jgi:hypothetical protein
MSIPCIAVFRWMDHLIFANMQICSSSCCMIMRCERRGRLFDKSCGKAVKGLKGAKSHTFPLRRFHDSKPATMRFFQAFASASVRSGTQAAAVGIPGLGGVGEILSAIIMLCDTVPQNRYMHTPRSAIIL